MFANAIDRLNANGSSLSVGTLSTVLTIFGNDFHDSHNHGIGVRVSFFANNVGVFQRSIDPNLSIAELVGELLNQSGEIGTRCQNDSNNNLSKDLLRVCDALALRIYEVDPAANFARLRTIANAI